MDIFRELYVSATAEEMAELVGAIEQSLPAGWARDHAAEEWAQSGPFGRGPAYCFACQPEGQRAAALVTLAQKDPDTFFVSNILPVARHQLARSEYNFILEEFCERLLRPAAERAGLKPILSSAAVGLEHWMSAATAEKLRSFSAAANKGIRTSRSGDREKWNDFVLSAHQERSSLSPSTLKRWLIEVEGWSPEVADQLAIEYQSGRELLSYAEGHRRSA